MKTTEQIKEHMEQLKARRDKIVDLRQETLGAPNRSDFLDALSNEHIQINTELRTLDWVLNEAPKDIPF